MSDQENVEPKKTSVPLSELPEQQKVWQDFYEGAWQLRVDLLKDMIAKGEKNPIRLMNQFRRFSATHDVVFDGRADSTKKEKAQFKRTDFSKWGQLFPTGKPIVKKIPMMEDFVIVPYYASPMEFLNDFIDQQETPFDAIVELGAGLNANLVELYYHGGPKNIPYYAGEFTKSGRESAEVLSSIDKDFKIKSFAFDWRTPDLSTIKETDGNILVFSCHSIEQVTKISTEVFRSISKAAKYVTCFHFEPFGFQISLGAKEGPVTQSQRSNFEKNGWNLNMAECLMKASDEKSVFIKFLAKNCFGGETHNPTSLAYWVNQKKNDLMGGEEA